MIKRAFGVVVALYALAVVAAAVAIDGFGDVHWAATALMFAPRWVFALPLLVLVPYALRHRRSALVPLAACVILLLGPIADLRLPIRRLAGSGLSRDLRVMTYNIGGGHVDGARLAAWVKELGVDVVAIQERDGGVLFPAMNMSCHVGLCLASRFPLGKADVRDQTEFLAKHGSGAIVRHEVITPRGRLDVTNVHLATVRDGLAEVMKRGPRGAAALDRITGVRREEAEAARAFALAGSHPVVVLGDFNTPVESAIYRASWSQFENAFSVAGFGFGATKHTRYHGVRIDHVLAGKGLSVLKAWVGPGLGGDHRPMIADLRFVGF